MQLSSRWTPRLAVVLVALAVALIAIMAAVAGARDPVPSRAATVPFQDDAPRNVEGEAATGDTQAMLAVVQDVVDCLTAKGFHPGDPQAQGGNVVIADWDPDWDSAAGHATEECSFPAR